MDEDLFIDINPILSSNTGTTSSRVYSVIIHTEKNDVEVNILESIECLRDFSNNTTDYIVIKCSIYGSAFLDIYNNRDNLEITISYDDPGSKTISNRYKLLLLNHYENADTNMMSRSGFANKTIFNIVGQCLNIEFEALRASYASGVYKETNLLDVLYSSFSTAIKELTINGAPLDIAINITTPNNASIYNRIVIPTGTFLLDLPSYLQEVSYGLFNGGVGVYLTDYNGMKSIFIYPLYNQDLFSEAENKAVIFNLANSKYDLVENTYLEDGNIFKILSTSSIKSHDKGDNTLSSMGSAIVFSDPYLIQNRNAKIDDKSILFDSEAQMRSMRMKKKRDGVDRQLYFNVSSNAYAARSDLVMLDQSIYTIRWNNSNSFKIFPGMPSSIVYKDKAKGIIILEGTAQSIYEVYDARSKTTNSLVNIASKKAIFSDSNKIYR